MTAPHDELRRLLAAKPQCKETYPFGDGERCGLIRGHEGHHTPEVDVLRDIASRVPSLLDECAALTAERDALRATPSPLNAESLRILNHLATSDLIGDEISCAVGDALAMMTAQDGARQRAESRATEAEADELETIAERDAREKQIERIHEHTGCEREWTNLHDLGECCIEQVAAMAAMAERVTAAEAEAGRLREALEAAAKSLETASKCGTASANLWDLEDLRPWAANRAMVARTALAAGPAGPTKDGAT